MSSTPMPPKLAALKADPATVSALRLMKCFLQLRSDARREKLIALAERMLEEEEKYPVAPDD